MKAAPEQWILTTPAMFDKMLGSVPPSTQHPGAFLMGEAHHFDYDGNAIYACFKKKDGAIYARYMTLKQFRSES